MPEILTMALWRPSLRVVSPGKLPFPAYQGRSGRKCLVL